MSGNCLNSFANHQSCLVLPWPRVVSVEYFVIFVSKNFLLCFFVFVFFCRTCVPMGDPLSTEKWVFLFCFGRNKFVSKGSLRQAITACVYRIAARFQHLKTQRNTFSLLKTHCVAVSRAQNAPHGGRRIAETACRNEP